MIIVPRQVRILEVGLNPVDWIEGSNPGSSSNYEIAILYREPIEKMTSPDRIRAPRFQTRSGLAIWIN